MYGLFVFIVRKPCGLCPQTVVTASVTEDFNHTHELFLLEQYLASFPDLMAPGRYSGLSVYEVNSNLLPIACKWAHSRAKGSSFHDNFVLLMPGESETLLRRGQFSKHPFSSQQVLVKDQSAILRSDSSLSEQSGRLAEGFYHISSGVEEIFCFAALELMCSLTSSFLLVF